MDNNQIQLVEEYEYFLSKLPEFITERPEKYVLIVKTQVIGFYDTISEAVTRAVTAFTLGTFFIELCTADKDYYKVVSRIGEAI